jgi:AcrR family transcriptional regulator
VLLQEAATLFAERGIDAVSVDCVAESAGRTSGAVYDHFGSKHGLLLAVLDEWSHGLVQLVTSEFRMASGLEDRLKTVASRVILQPSVQTRRLLMLERELALRAVRDPRVAVALRSRAREAQRLLTTGFAAWIEQGLLPEHGPPPQVLALTFRSLVLEMELQQRLDPQAFDLESACAVLSGALQLRAPLPTTTSKDRSD